MFRKIFSKTLLVLILVFVFGVANIATGFGQKNNAPRVVSGVGIARVQSQDVLVEVFVEVMPWETAKGTIENALRAQGATPLGHSTLSPLAKGEGSNLGSEGFAITGLVWSENPIQNYNAGSASTASEPVASKQSLLNTYETWNSVEIAWIEMEYGEDTDRCPSLVRECKGPQTWDGNDDVAWLRLQPGVLGVAWFGNGPYGPEADIALSTRFSWSTDGGSGYDVETVFLHENGHLLGLGHSSYEEAVMYAYYAGINRELHSDDKEGLTYLYDNDITGVVSGAVTDADGNPVVGAAVTLVGTNLSATADENGLYTMSGMPDPVTYDVSVSASGYKSTGVRQIVDGETTIDFVLHPQEETEEPEEPKCPPGWQRQGRC